MFEEESPDDEHQFKSPFGSSFRTFDATDYSSIATIDIKKMIYDLAVDPGDNFIAVIENGPAARDLCGMSPSDNVCRLYEVGRTKEPDEEVDEEEEEEEDDNVDDDDDDESDDDLLDGTDDFAVRYSTSEDDDGNEDSDAGDDDDDEEEADNSEFESDEWETEDSESSPDSSDDDDDSTLH